MPPSEMALQIAKTLSDDPDLAFAFYCAASEIVDDFEDYGPVIQATVNGDYDDTTAIGRLLAARARLLSALR